jgi:hypothetical protein
MMKVTLFVHKDASLRRIEEVAREAEALGLVVTAVSPGLCVITGRSDSRDLIPRLQAIKDVRAVK